MIRIIKNCPSCGSRDLILKARENNKNIFEALKVELRCNSCNKWIKWVPKKERKIYLGILDSNFLKVEDQIFSPSKDNKKDTKLKNKRVKLEQTLDPEFDNDKIIKNLNWEFKAGIYKAKSEKLQKQLDIANSKILELENKLKQVKG